MLVGFVLGVMGRHLSRRGRMWRGEKYMPRSRQVAKKLMESGRKLRKVFIGSHTPVSRSSFVQLHIAFTSSVLSALAFCVGWACY